MEATGNQDHAKIILQHKKNTNLKKWFPSTFNFISIEQTQDSSSIQQKSIVSILPWIIALWQATEVEAPNPQTPWVRKENILPSPDEVLNHFPTLHHGTISKGFVSE